MLYEITIPQFTKMLKNMDAILLKAAAFADMKKIDAKVLLNSRLAPDQFAFTRQVQIMCDTAKGLAARLSGQEPPKHEDVEQTIEELRARIQKTLAFIATVKPEQFNGAEKRMVAIPWMQGKGIQGYEYTLQMAMPNFFFHATVAYEILRHNGVELGKGDYLGALPYQNL